MKDWWKDPFQKGWYPLSAISADWKKRTAGEVKDIAKILQLKKNSALLDVGCGVGRHSIALARMGYRVTGIDISPAYLKEARRNARAAGVEIRFLQRDMRNLGFEEEFDGVINLFSSFGYFKKESDDKKVLGEIFRSLKPEGVFLIDNLSWDFLKTGFVAQSWQELSDGTLLLENRKPTRTRIMEADWLFVSKNGRRKKMHSAIRAYGEKELTSAMRGAGFSRVKRYPALNGNGTVTKTMMRLVLLAQKK